MQNQTIRAAKLLTVPIFLTWALPQVTDFRIHMKGSSKEKGNCVVPNGSIISPCISQSGFLPYNYEIPHNMGSVLVKEIRIVPHNIFVHEVQVGMQSTGTICTALVFVRPMFLCQLVDVHSEVEYITLIMFLRAGVILRWFFFWQNCNRKLSFIFPSLLHMLYFQNRKCFFRKYASLFSYWNKDGRDFSFPVIST